MYDQQRLRPACAYAQTDQSLCWSLKSMTDKLLTEPHLRFLSLQGGCTDSSESTLVKIPHCWKSRVMAHCYRLCPACAAKNKTSANINLYSSVYYIRKPICDIVFCVMSFLFRCFDFLLSCFEFLVYAFCVRCCSF